MKATKENVNKLFDYLADKTLTKGVFVLDKYEPYPLELVGDEECGDGFRYYQPAGGQIKELVESEISKILGHPILLGGVLSRMKKSGINDEFHEFESHIDRALLERWYKCEADKSLQQIVEKSGYFDEAVECSCERVSSCKDCLGSGVFPVNRLKDPKARNLIEFLLEIFKDKLK